ncbi:MAG: hypothetical protein K2Y20_08580 [Sphingomonas sp.]|nr:hypothetical protein [Sphingomonas sp.]
MTKIGVWALPLAAALALPAAAIAQEQAAPEGPDITITDPEKIPLPTLSFTETPADVGDYDKYFYFARANTDFATAFADIKDCDDLARNPSGKWKSAGAGGILGALLDSAMNEGPAARATRRVSMRRCMFYKGYSRFGLPRALWVRFNFEEAMVKKGEQERDAYMRLQARAAAAGIPATKELEP